MGTSPGRLNWHELWCTIRETSLLALAFFVTELAERISHIDFGSCSPVVVVTIAWLANLVKAWVSDNRGDPRAAEEPRDEAEPDSAETL